MDNPSTNITEGVQEDCETLLLKYEKLKSVRFTDFTTIWREMKFTAIFADKNLTEIDIFVPEVILMAKQYFVKASTFNLKVGALYLLYGLYYKQPLKNFKKILITLTDWEVISKFMVELRENNHFDTLLILSKLIADNAFVWSAVSTIRRNIIPEQYFRYGLFDTNSLIDDVDIEVEFNELKEIEKQYTEAKSAAVLKTETNALINYSNNNLTDELLELLNSSAMKSVSENVPEEPTIEKSEPSIGDRRRKLKHRSFEDKSFGAKKTSK